MLTSGTNLSFLTAHSKQNTRSGSVIFTPPTSKPSMPPPPRPHSERIQSQEKDNSQVPVLLRGHSDGVVQSSTHENGSDDSDSDCEIQRAPSDGM